MDALNPHSTITLPAGCCNRFHGMAFDGFFFYLTAPQECSIYKFKRDFTIIKNIKTEKPYSCICYDNTENCFWVTVKKHNDIIYKLDCDMKEIGLLRVKNCKTACSSIIGLSYNCEKNTLLTAYQDHIIEVPKESGSTCIIKETCERFYTAVLSIAPYYAIVQQDEQEQKFQIFTYEGCRVKNFCIPALYSIKDVLFYPYNQHCQDEFEFLLLATKDDYYQNILFFKINTRDMVLCNCNYKVCRTHCGEDDENNQCICDIIKSIALIETSLAHILNAEGEKLQKAVEVADSVDELLAVNKSVTKAIINITQLEHNLYLKLDALNDLCKTPAHNNDEIN